MKLVSIALLCVITLLACHLYLRAKDNPEQLIPFPYIFNNYVVKDIKKAQNSQITIIGDQSAKELDKFLPELIQDLSINLKDPIKIFNWSSSNEGIHRSIVKLKSLKKWPPIIIYMAGNSHFYEKKFHLRDFNIIKNNFKKYRNEKLSTLIMAYPPFSKIIYETPHYINFDNKINKDDSNKNGLSMMAYYSLTYEVYQNEVEKLMMLARDNKSTLIVVTTPLNLEVSPKMTCENTKTLTMLKFQEEIEKLLEQGQNKSAYKKVKKLSVISKANAKTWFLLGRANLELGRSQDAIAAFEKATTFDCKAWRANAATNAILVKKAKKMGNLIIDFNSLVNKNLGRDALFLDSIKPQSVYYERFINQLKKTIKTILHL